jgi:hypothetical protein
MSFFHNQVNVEIRLCACTWDVIGEYCGQLTGYPESAAWFSSVFQLFYKAVLVFHFKNYHRFLTNPLSSWNF